MFGAEGQDVTSWT
jgi:hypothetical protein